MDLLNWTCVFIFLFSLKSLLRHHLVFVKWVKRVKWNEMWSNVNSQDKECRKSWLFFRFFVVRLLTSLHSTPTDCVCCLFGFNSRFILFSSSSSSSPFDSPTCELCLLLFLSSLHLLPIATLTMKNFNDKTFSSTECRESCLRVDDLTFKRWRVKSFA